MKRANATPGPALLAIFSFATLALLAACQRNDGLVDNPACADDLTILATDGGATTMAAPCALDGQAAAPSATDDPGADDDAGAGLAPPFSCGSYFCICDDMTTQSGSSADPVTGACDEESQTCTSLCVTHGGWM